MAEPRRLTPNRKKILEAILLVLSKAAASRRTVTQYEIVKTLFVADVRHLGKYGRPITFDNYVAMEFGPVPSESYDMLKPSYRGWDALDEVGPLWEREPEPRGGSRAFKYVRPKRAPNLSKLSETDAEEIEKALFDVRKLGFSGTRDWTHKHPAYVAAWQDDGPAKSYPMDYRLLLKDDDKDLVDDLAHASHYM